MMEQWNNGKKKKTLENNGMKVKKILYGLKSNIPKFFYSTIPAFED